MTWHANSRLRLSRIDDGAWQTKRALTAVVFFFTLAETRSLEKQPSVTIPAQ